MRCPPQPAAQVAALAVPHHVMHAFSKTPSSCSGLLHVADSTTHDPRRRSFDASMVYSKPGCSPLFFYSCCCDLLADLTSNAKCRYLVGSSFRLVHGMDPVPTLPPPGSSFFKHVKGQMWLHDLKVELLKPPWCDTAMPRTAPCCFSGKATEDFPGVLRSNLPLRIHHLNLLMTPITLILLLQQLHHGGYSEASLLPLHSGLFLRSFQACRIFQDSSGTV
jgi:hypothetical protein